MLRLTHPSYGVMLIHPAAIRTISHWQNGGFNTRPDCKSSVEFGDNPHAFAERPSEIAAKVIEAGHKLIHATDARTNNEVWFAVDHITAVRFEEKYARVYVGRGALFHSDLLVYSGPIDEAVAEGKL